MRDANRSVLDDPVHDPNIFGKAAAGSLESGRATYLLVGRALREGLVPAVKTVTAGNVMKDHHPVAGTVLRDALADRGYYAGGFVSEDARGGMGAGRNLLQIGAADSARVHADQHFAGTDFGDGDSF